MFDHIKKDGIYLCEDNHTSYWFNFGGGMKRKGTYMEYVKNLIDVVHLWYAGKNTYIKNHKLKEQIYAIHIYDSIVVMEKKEIKPPFDKKAGNFTVGYLDEDKLSLLGKAKLFLFNIKNRIRSMKYK
jgi:sugar phosphate isomerase/epimerase